MPDPEPISMAEILLSIASIKAAFAAVKDPRRDHLKRFLLSDILVLAVAGMLAGCEDWVDIEDFGDQRAEWFKAHGLFPQGTPSHDTLGRVFRVLDAVIFRTCFAQWVQQAMGTVSGVIAIDGKTSRGTADGDTRGAIHTVSAYASESGLTLAHTAVTEKSNEITAIPKLLEMLALKGCTVTIDAMGCQKDIATCIRKRGGDYLLQVKANQPSTLNDLSTFFADADARGWKDTDHTTARTDSNKHDHGHGRDETRIAHACRVQGPWLDAHGWTDLHQIVRIRRTRSISGATSTEDSYYITSEHCDATRLLSMARQHWGIEATHWILDVAFNEDRSRARKDNAAHNLVTIRRFVLNLLRRNPETKHRSIKRRRRRAGYGMEELCRLMKLAAVSPGE
jgi:predicted transposase YbfD/YdcC